MESNRNKFSWKMFILVTIGTLIITVFIANLDIGLRGIPASHLEKVKDYSIALCVSLLIGYFVARKGN